MVVDVGGGGGIGSDVGEREEKTTVGGPNALVAFPFFVGDGFPPALTVAFVVFVGVLFDDAGTFVVFVAVALVGEGSLAP